MDRSPEDAGRARHMDVISHKAVCQNGHTVTFACILKQVDIGKSIIITEKDIEPTISPLDNIVWISRNYNARDSYHNKSRMANIKNDCNRFGWKNVIKLTIMK